MDGTGPYSQALLTYRAGLQHNPEGEELEDGERRAMDGIDKSGMSDRLKKIVKGDPELGAVMHDPAIMQVLGDLHSNPEVAAALMKNPEVAAKVRKLMDSGILDIRRNA